MKSLFTTGAFIPKFGDGHIRGNPSGESAVMSERTFGVQYYGAIQDAIKKIITDLGDGSVDPSTIFYVVPNVVFTFDYGFLNYPDATIQ